MFRTVTVAGLGPCDDITLDLDPAGVTTLVGPSEAGKTTAAEALLWLLTGETLDGGKLDPARIRAEHKAASVVGVTGKGTTISRSMTRARSTTRTIAGASYTSEEAFAAALKGVAERVTADGRSYSLARLVMAPMSWLPLLASGGRALRDVIAPHDPRRLRTIIDERLVKDGFKATADGEDLTVKGVEASRRAARSAADTSAGAAQEAHRALDRLKAQAPPVPTRGDLDAARMIVAESVPWGAYDRAVAEHAQAVAAYEAAVREVAVWGAERQRLVDAIAEEETALSQLGGSAAEELDANRVQVSDVKAEIARHEGAISTLTVELGDTPRVLADADRALRNAQVAHYDATRAAEDAKPCPTCGTPGFDWVAERGRRHLALHEAEVAWQDAKRASDEAHAADLARRMTVESTARAAIADARVRLDELLSAQADLQERHDAWTATAADHKASQRSLAEHMQRRPKAPSRPGDAPEPPGGERATPEALAEARRLLTEHTAAEGARRQHDAQIETAKADAEAASARWRKDDAAFKRSEALLEAVRSAPDALFAEGVAAMGDLGAVRLSLVQGEVVVMVGPYPFSALSTGAQVHADALFRSGLRRRFGRSYLPIIIDRAQDWTGGFADVPGPVVLLVTEPGQGVRSSVAVKEAA